MQKFIIKWSQNVRQDFKATVDANDAEAARELLMSGEVDGELIETYFNEPAEYIEIEAMS